MSSVLYKNGTSQWHTQLIAWVEPIMQCIDPLSEGLPKASARIIERDRQVAFELQVEWCDKLMGETLHETFIHEVDK